MNRRNLSNANAYMSTRVGGQRSPWYPAASEDTTPDADLPAAANKRETESPGSGDDDKPSEPTGRRYRPEGPLLL